MAELNPQIQKQLKIIAASPAIINNILFFRKNISNEIKEKAEKAIEQMKSSVYGQQLLMVIKSDNIVKLEPSNLDSFNQLFNEYEERMQQWKNQVNTQQTGE
jgi:ABC-type phosphate/phosphonate transport system substrate-binding protein